MTTSKLNEQVQLLLEENERLKHEIERLTAESKALVETTGHNAPGVTDLNEREDLRLAKESAESASREKDEFLANMSHEIRTPMNAVIGMAHLLLDMPLGEKERSYVEAIRSSAGALLSIVNDILDFSKIEAGKLTLEMLDFSIQNLLDDVMTTMAIRGNEKPIEMSCSINPDVPLHFLGDPGRLRQILVNLVGNAIKFTEKGEVSVHVILEEMDQNQVTLRLSVADTGIGVAEDRVGLLFEKFTQADSSITRNYGGTGLGLAISKRLSELMGGQIGVESRLGEGSTFWFTAVLQTQPKEIEGTKATLSNQPTVIRYTEAPQIKAATIRKRKVKILVVEDNPINRLVTMDTLKIAGYTADSVDNGEEAVETLRKDAYHLVLMDVQMPVMDGLTATRAIRDPSSGVLNPQLPIIALTAHATKKDREECFAAGMDGYVSKPVQPDELQQIIERRLFGSAAPPRPEHPEHPMDDGKSCDTKMFDRSSFLERIDGDEELCNKVLKMFVEHTQELIDSLEQAIGDEDAIWAQQSAHSIKGASLNICAQNLADVAYEIEKAGKDHALDKAHSLFDTLNREYIALKEVLVETLESDPHLKVLDTDNGPIVVSEILDMNVDRSQKLVGLFFLHIPNSIEALRYHVEQQNLEKLRAEAHKIKGSCVSFGALRMGQLCKELEAVAQEGDLSLAEDLIYKIAEEFDLVHNALESLA